MHRAEIEAIAAALDTTVRETTTLAGGFSHETCLLAPPTTRIVARLGGTAPEIEAAVMARAGRHVPVPTVLAVLTTGPRPAMLLEHVAGRPLSHALADGDDLTQLGSAVGAVAAAIGTTTFDRPGFFADPQLTVRPQAPRPEQLPEFAARCMAATPPTRLADPVRQAWADLCVEHAPALAAIESHARLTHGDVNPKNILVTKDDTWRVTAVLDREFAYSGCPYGDAANMLRFAADYPPDFVTGFRTAFAEHQPTAPPPDWLHLGRVLDMFALSDLVTRPAGHPVADQAAEVIRLWVATGVPR